MVQNQFTDPAKLFVDKCSKARNYKDARFPFMITTSKTEVLQTPSEPHVNLVQGGCKSKH